MTQQVTPEQVLDAAAEYIHEHGWCRAVVQDDEGRVCLEGSITVPFMTSIEQQEPALFAWSALRKSLGKCPIVWNDHVCKDADEAVEALKRAKEFL